MFVMNAKTQQPSEVQNQVTAPGIVFSEESARPNAEAALPLSGRQAVPELLARRFPGVFRTLEARSGQLALWRRRSLGDSVRALARRARAQIRRWGERVREREVLRRLGDRELSDLGLSRSQVLMELNKPFWRD
jgi:uncharacterized protein YjiS (DUF1127 family)